MGSDDELSEDENEDEDDLGDDMGDDESFGQVDGTWSEFSILFAHTDTNSQTREKPIYSSCLN